jgi:hypothetical protein
MKPARLANEPHLRYRASTWPKNDRAARLVRNCAHPGRSAPTPGRSRWFLDWLDQAGGRTTV